MKRRDRVFVYLYLLVLLISPWILNTASIFFNASASGKLKAIVQVNESRGNKYALSVLKGRDDPVELFSYALALKREGRYTEAIFIYNELVAKRPTARRYTIILQIVMSRLMTLERQKNYIESQLNSNLFLLRFII